MCFLILFLLTAPPARADRSACFGQVHSVETVNRAAIEMMRTEGFRIARHRRSFPRVIEILKNGQLTGVVSKQGKQAPVYLELVHESKFRSFRVDEATFMNSYAQKSGQKTVFEDVDAGFLIFDLEVFSAPVNFHVSEGWSYGVFQEGLSAKSFDLESLRSVLERVRSSPRKSEMNEVVLSGSISLESLIGIRVANAAAGERLVSSLRAHGINAIHGKPIESFIQVDGI